MITPQTPTTQPTNFSVPAQIQVTARPTNGYSNVVKEVYLRHLIDGSIKQDEQKQVVTGVNIIDLKTNRTLVSHNEDTEQFAASINKLPVSLLLLEDLRSGNVDMDQTVSWTDSDRRGGYGNFDQPGAPLQAPLRDVLYDMLHRSGNTAVRVIVNNVLGGPQAVNDRWATKPQLSRTRLQLLDPTHFYLGNSTPHDSLWAMRQLMLRPDQYANFMKNAMADNIFTDFGVRSQLTGSDYIMLVNKIGLLDDPTGNNRHDVGIIYNTKTHQSYGYSLMTTAPYNATDASATTQAEQSLKDMGGALLRFAGGQKGHRATDTSAHQFEARIRY